MYWLDGSALAAGAIARHCSARLRKDFAGETQRGRKATTNMNNEELEQQLHKLQNDFAGLCALFHVQQEALEKLGAVVEMHQRNFEGHRPPPDPGRTARN